MRILVNGYFYGGNCPPFIRTLKAINPETMLTNTLSVLDEHGMNRDYLEPGDILRLSLNFLEKAFVIACKKARLPMWKPMLTRKATRLIRLFKPDIIINHKASEKAEIMLRTGFRPQLTYIYGGEVHGARVMRRELDYIFDQSAYVLTTTEQMQSYLVSKRRELKEKTRVFPMGYFELERIRAYAQSASRNVVRRNFGFAEDEAIFFDNRSLRGNHAGFTAIIQALRELHARGLSFKMIFLRGFLGTPAMTGKLKAILRNEPDLARHIVLIDEIVPEEKVIDYYFMADAFVSLLPADQCGKCINDAVFLDCSLILSDLGVYRSRLGEGPCYIQDQDPAQLAAAFARIIEGGRFKVTVDAYERLVEMAQTKLRFASLQRFLNEVVAESHHETSIA
jgi:hypothetical protein